MREMKITSKSSPELQRLFFFIKNTKRNHSSANDWRENTNLILMKMLELFPKIQENIRISILKRRLQNLYKKENFKLEVKPMVENLQDELCKSIMQKL